MEQTTVSLHEVLRGI